VNVGINRQGRSFESEYKDGSRCLRAYAGEIQEVALGVRNRALIILDDGSCSSLESSSFLLRKPGVPNERLDFCQWSLRQLRRSREGSQKPLCGALSHLVSGSVGE